MTTIFSTIMLAALSSGARLFFGTFVVFVALMCIWVVWALIVHIRKMSRLREKSFGLTAEEDANLHIANMCSFLTANSHNSSGSNS